MKRLNPIRPAIIALTCSALGVGGYALGFRGKYRAPAGQHMDIDSALRMFWVVFGLAFICLYALQIIGVKIQLFGVREKK